MAAAISPRLSVPFLSVSISEKNDCNGSGSSSFSIVPLPFLSICVNIASGDRFERPFFASSSPGDVFASGAGVPAPVLRGVPAAGAACRGPRFARGVSFTSGRSTLSR